MLSGGLVSLGGGRGAGDPFSVQAKVVIADEVRAVGAPGGLARPPRWPHPSGRGPAGLGCACSYRVVSRVPAARSWRSGHRNESWAQLSGSSRVTCSHLSPWGSASPSVKRADVNSSFQGRAPGFTPAFRSHREDGKAGGHGGEVPSSLAGLEGALQSPISAQMAGFCLLSQGTRLLPFVRRTSRGPSSSRERRRACWSRGAQGRNTSRRLMVLGAHIHKGSPSCEGRRQTTGAQRTQCRAVKTGGGSGGAAGG